MDKEIENIIYYLCIFQLSKQVGHFLFEMKPLILFALNDTCGDDNHYSGLYLLSPSK